MFISPSDFRLRDRWEPQGCFRGFKEAAITFAPSYKYDVLKLKRARTLHRSNTANSISSVSDIRKARHTSAPVSSLASASRTTLPIDEEDEDMEDDDDDERATLASSRASVSSAVSGFENAYDREGNPIPRDRDREASPSTPSAERIIIDKAKNFFNLVRSKSSSNAHGQPSPRLESHEELATAHPVEETSTDNVTLKTSVSPEESILLGRAAGNERDLLPSEAQGSTSSNTNLQESLTPNAGTAVFGPPIFVSPALNASRPRLHSSQSSATILSLAESRELAYEKQLADDTVYDSSSKKRVQSWTDRILYKSTMQEIETTEASIQGSRYLGSGFLDSLKGVKRSILNGNTQQTTNASRPAPRTGTQKVSFTPYVTQSMNGDALTPTSLAALPPTPPLFMRRNTSRSSFAESDTAGSQQRLNQRFAKLFSRYSPRVSTDAIDTSSIATAVSPVPDASSTSSLGRADDNGNASQIGQQTHDRSTSLVRSFSAGSRHKPIQSNAQRKVKVFRSNSESYTASRAVNYSPNLLETHHLTQPLRPADATTAVSTIASGLGMSHLHSMTPRALLATPEEDCTSAGCRASNDGIPSQMALISPFSASEPNASGFKSTLQTSQPVNQSDVALFGPPYRSEASNEVSDAELKDKDKDQDPSQAAALEGRQSKAFPVLSQIETRKANDARIVSNTNTNPNRQTGIRMRQSKTTPVSSSGTNPGSGAHSGPPRHWWNSPLFHSLHPQINSPLSSSINDGSLASQSDDRTPTLGMPPSGTDAEGSAPHPPPPDPLSEPIVKGPRRGEVQCIAYDAVADMRRMQACSDHRPVVAVFALGL